MKDAWSFGKTPVGQKILPALDAGAPLARFNLFDQRVSRRSSATKRWSAASQDTVRCGEHLRLGSRSGPRQQAPTGMERTTLGFYNRMKQASDVLDQLEPQLQKMSAAGAAGSLWAPNIFKTKLGQQYLQALRMYTEARLRKESGAAVPESEVQRDQMVFGFQVGDKDPVMTQKRQARRQVADALAFSADRLRGVLRLALRAWTGGA